MANALESLATLLGGPRRANVPLDLAEARDINRRNLRRNLAKRGQGFYTGGTPEDLEMLEEDIAQDPGTGFVERKRIKGIQDLNDYLTQYERPDVKRVREQEFEYKIAPERLKAETARETARAAGEYGLARQALANQGMMGAAAMRAGSGAQKLQSSLLERVAGAQASLGTLGKMKQQFNPDYVGPAAGRANTLRQYIPGISQDPAFAEFKANTDVLTNAVIKAITGAQMSEPEARRIKGQIPSITDPPDVWHAKARATEENLQYMLQRIEELRQGGSITENEEELNYPSSSAAVESSGGVSPGMAGLGALGLGAAGLYGASRLARNPSVQRAVGAGLKTSAKVAPFALLYEFLKGK